jgi:hypothetical protein
MKKKKAKIKSAKIYDENGRWVEERGRIKGAIRRVFRLFPQGREALVAARVELPPAILKDGSIGKKNQIRFRCADCKKLFSQKNVQVDHISTVVPLHIEEKNMSYDDIVRGICCHLDNLQVLCSTRIKDLPKGEKSCHNLKSRKEGFIRDRFVEYLKNNKLRGCDLDINVILTLTLNFNDMFVDYLDKEKLKYREKEMRKIQKINKWKNKCQS